MNSTNRSTRRLRRWSAGAVLAAGAAVLGMGTAGADTPDDVIGQTISELNQGNVVLDVASTADLSTRQADALVEQTTLSTQTDPILLQLEGLQDNLPAGDQTLLGSVDEQLVTAAQSVVSADQAFVAADQAGALSSNSFLPVDLTTFEADLGLSGALLNADFESFFTLFDSGFATTGAASAAVLTSAAPAELLSQSSSDYIDANQILAGLPDSVSAYAPAIATDTMFQDSALQDIAQLGTSESALSSFDNGALSDFLNPVFSSVNQGWDQASEAALAADQAVQTAVATGSASDIAAAFIGTSAPEYQALGPDFQSAFIDIAAHLVAGSDVTSIGDLATGLDPLSAFDPSIFTDLLSSLGL